MLLAAGLFAPITFADEPALYRRARLPGGRVPNRPYTPSPDDAGWLLEDVWPPLYWGAEIVPEVRRKVAGLDWARRLFATLKEEAELVLAAPPLVPTERAGWRHDFYARDTGGPLLFEPERDQSFLDPLTGKRENAPGMHAAWVLLTHERTLRLMRGVGLLYALTGDEKYARWVASGVARFADYIEQTPPLKNGAIYYQPLYDAGIALVLLNTYSLTRHSEAYSPELHAKVRRVFDDRVPFLAGFLDKMAAHNMGAFASAAIGLAGEVFERSEWTTRAVNGKNGFAEQLKAGVPMINGKCDGFWGEGTHFYHFYTLTTLIPTYELARRTNQVIAPDVEARFRAMFDAPIQISDPQWGLPTLGDFGAPRHFSLPLYRHVYEYAAGRLDREKYAPLLAAFYQHIHAPRTDGAALAFGPDELPRAAEPLKTHTLLPLAQTGVFRSADPEMWLLFRCGKFAGGHDHPDRLSLFLSAHGTQITPDLGEPGYALRGKTGDYYQSTLAHNTLFADEKAQKGTANLLWQPDKNRARGEIKDGGVTFRRTLFFAPPFVVLLDEYESDAEHRFDWVYHAYGALQMTAPPAKTEAGANLLSLPPLPTEGAWAQLTQRQTTVAARSLSAAWQVRDGLQLRLLSASSAPFEATSGRSIGQPFPDDLGALVLRSSGRAWRLATVLEIAAGAPQASDVTLLADGLAVHVGGIQREFHWD